MHVWHEHTAASYYIWDMPDPDTSYHAHAMPPMRIPTRWGPKDECDIEMRNAADTPAHLKHFIEVLQLALDKRIRATARKSAQKPAQVSGQLECVMALADATLMDGHAYAMTMGT